MPYTALCTVFCYSFTVAHKGEGWYIFVSTFKEFEVRRFWKKLLAVLQWFIPGLPLIDLHKRLAIFVEHGFIRRVPTNWQATQGSLEMILYVITPKPGDRERYAGASFGRWWLRSPLLVFYTAGAYFRAGCGIRVRENSQRKHLLGVKHPEQPVYDLQLVQTFPNGLANLRQRFLEVREGKKWYRRFERRFLGLIVPNWDEYCEFLLAQIARAEAFDYDPAPAWCRAEHWSFVEFMNYCATVFPASPKEECLFPMVRRLCQLFLRRLRGYVSDYRPSIPNPQQRVS
jgi:hypothetical protein